MIRSLGGGVLVGNISRTHALYAEGKGFRVRLPRLDQEDQPGGGWFVSRGSVLVGSRAMLDDDQALRVAVGPEPGAGPAAGAVQAAGDATLLPLYLDPNTKLFLVALIWSGPGLPIRPGRRRCRVPRRSPGPRSRSPGPSTSLTASTRTRTTGTAWPRGSGSI